MSDCEDSRRSHDSAPLIPGWKDESNIYSPVRKGYGRILALIVFLLTFLSIFTVLFIHLSSSSTTPEAAISTEHDAATVGSEPRRNLKVLLHPQDHVSRKPGVRDYSWNITKTTIAPDGVEKQVYLINGQFPGPTIEARSGDTLKVEVFNHLDEEMSLHWHGLHMKGHNDMDGPMGVVQCGIPPGGSFTYIVPTDDQVGSFWFHAHSEIQRGDGLYGGLVIHNPNTVEHDLYGYDEELLFMVGDWYHKSSPEVLAAFMSITSEGLEPCPDSLLINGLGQFDCDMAIPASPVNCTEVEKPELLLNKQTRYRIRLVNVGSLTGISLAIPDSNINAIQVDGGLPVVSHPSTSIGVLYPAERVDFVVDWPGSGPVSDGEITIQLDKEYFLRPNFALTSTQSFPLRAEPAYQQRGMMAKKTDQDQSTDLPRFDLRGAKGPRLTDPLPDTDDMQKFMLYTVVEVLAHQNHIPKGFINHTTWEPQTTPLIATERDSWDTHQLVPWTGSRPTWVELTINNIDGTGHPFHLHGFDFYVVASYEGNGGFDYYNPFDPAKPPHGGPFNVVDPIRKDTVYVPPYGYVVIRFLADNEGIWALHCHVLWHQASGMSMALQVLGDKQSGMSESPAGKRAKQFCAAGHQ